MREITYVLKAPMGLHGRPAGLLAGAAGKYKCAIEVGSPAKMVNAKRVIGVMALTLKQGNEVTMTFDGDDEEAAAAFFADFLEKNV
ncbi:HPr family phosphocarrier protein [Breznakiella homolactica]|uniref:HPr family phosphocarrier protein n=1 Tax=Breznakiella homolactica TaxID=2798577 RepID=A0A7T7XLF6_9SPIR|nr:HPr family phosphocarrier protein [Breznakiella homolactica]QQO08536.1 HPr family phosphocarrier protein [Breznakiella homolactica]